MVVPSRWVIDLANAGDVLLRPENDHTVGKSEDRLFVPSEYVPLFVRHGWREQT